MLADRSHEYGYKILANKYSNIEKGLYTMPKSDWSQEWKVGIISQNQLMY